MQRTRLLSALILLASGYGCEDQITNNYYGADGDPSDGVAGDGDEDGFVGDGDGDGDGVVGDGAGAGDGDGDELTGSYEGEDAFHAGTGVQKCERSGFSGTGYLDALAEPEARLVFTVNAASDGDSRITLRHAGAEKQLAMRVNGAPVADITLPNASDFASFEATLALRRGLNTIMLLNRTAGDAVSIDKLDLAGDAGRATRGATVAFRELEAEDGETNAVAIGPDVTYDALAASASGRRAVTLAGEGSYVEWTAPEAANALTLRFSLPDSAGGGGSEGSVRLVVDGEDRQTLALSSRRAWLYGAWTDGQGFSNEPQAGAMMPFIEERFLVSDIAAGAKVRLVREQGDVSVDLIDLERAAEPYAQPEGSVSIVDQGAVAGDGQDDRDALLAAITEAKAGSGVVFIPPGEFQLGGPVDVDHVTLRGAGPWHSTLRQIDGDGGFQGAGDAVQLLDFAIVGDIDRRNDAGDRAAIQERFGTGSLIQNLYIQGTKVGIWFVDTHGAYVTDVLVRDTYADGVNFNTNVEHTAAEHMHVRNTGDDCFAMWATGQLHQGNRFKFVSAISPNHANGVALYGGTGPRLEDALIADIVRDGAAVKISTQFNPQPFAGDTAIERVTIQRGGSIEPGNGGSVGALRFAVWEKPIDAQVVVRDVLLEDSSHDAVEFTHTNAVSQVAFENVSIEGAKGYGIRILTPGAGTFTNVSVSEASEGGADISPTFTATKVGGEGW